MPDPMIPAASTAWAGLARRVVWASLVAARAQAHVELLRKSERLQQALYEIADLAGADLELGDMLRRVHAVVGALILVSNVAARRLTNGRVHGSAIAIVLGLVLAYFGGVLTGGKKGLADIPALAGIGLMFEGSWDWGLLWVDFALVAFAASFVVGLFVISPMAKRLPAVGPTTPEGQELTRRIFAILRVDLASCTRSSSR